MAARSVDQSTVGTRSTDRSVEARCIPKRTERQKAQDWLWRSWPLSSNGVLAVSTASSAGSLPSEDEPIACVATVEGSSTIPWKTCPSNAASAIGRPARDRFQGRNGLWKIWESVYSRLPNCCRQLLLAISVAAQVFDSEVSLVFYRKAQYLARSAAQVGAGILNA